jgi:hypothetical protein
MKSNTSKKVLIWALAIAGVGLATYVVISLTRKPVATNNKLFSAEDISAVGSAIAGLFKKSSTTEQYPNTDVYYQMMQEQTSDPSLDLGYTVSETPEG